MIKSRGFSKSNSNNSSAIFVLEAILEFVGQKVGSNRCAIWDAGYPFISGGHIKPTTGASYLKMRNSMAVVTPSFLRSFLFYYKMAKLWNLVINFSQADGVALSS